MTGMLPGSRPLCGNRSRAGRGIERESAFTAGRGGPRFFFARSHTPQDLADFIANNETDFINFKTKLLLGTAGDDPVERARLITDIVRSIAKFRITSCVPSTCGKLPTSWTLRNGFYIPKLPRSG